MTNYGDTNDWILLYDGTDNVYLKTEKQPSIDNIDDGVIEVNYPARGHYGDTLVTEKVSVKISNVYATTEATFKEIIKGLRAIQDRGDTIYLKIKITSSGDFFEFDGNGNTLMPVIIRSIKGIKKLYGGDSTIFEIGMIQLFQSGALTAP